MFQEPIMRNIVLGVGVAAVIALLAYTYSSISQARYMTQMPVTISVSGEGEVFGKPDIASFSFSVNAREADAVSAQNKSAEAVNAILAYLKEKGIEDKDVKVTGYYLNPEYEYPTSLPCERGYCPPTGERKLTGYEVNQTVSVKVRDTKDNRIGMLISGVGELGATNINGPEFTIDDDSSLKAEARAQAIADANEQALKLAKDLNVRIVRMTGFWEDEGGYPMYNSYGMEKSMSMDSAGAAPIAPSMPMGENMITSRVNVSFEVR